MLPLINFRPLLLLTEEVEKRCEPGLEASDCAVVPRDDVVCHRVRDVRVKNLDRKLQSVHRHRILNAPNNPAPNEVGAECAKDNINRKHLVRGASVASITRRLLRAREAAASVNETDSKVVPRIVPHARHRDARRDGPLLYTQCED